MINVIPMYMYLVSCFWVSVGEVLIEVYFSDEGLPTVATDPLVGRFPLLMLLIVNILVSVFEEWTFIWYFSSN